MAVMNRDFPCERCGDSGAQITPVRIFAYDPHWGWAQVSGRVMRLLCRPCHQYFDVVEGWALDGTPPVESDLALIDQRKAAGKLWFDTARGLWRMR